MFRQGWAPCLPRGVAGRADVLLGERKCRALRLMLSRLGGRGRCWGASSPGMLLAPAPSQGDPGAELGSSASIHPVFFLEGSLALIPARLGSLREGRESNQQAVTSSPRSHPSHSVKPELQPHLQHGGRMKTALDRRGSLPNSLQLGREAPHQHSSPLTPKFDLPWSLEELREGQGAAQLSWGMDAVPLRTKPRCLGQRCHPQKQKLVRVPAPRVPGKVAASSE